MLVFGAKHSINNCVILMAKRYIFDLVHIKPNEDSRFFLTQLHTNNIDSYI